MFNAKQNKGNSISHTKTGDCKEQTGDYKEQTGDCKEQTHFSYIIMDNLHTFRSKYCTLLRIILVMNAVLYAERYNM